jgi:hypothetical protein
MKKRRVADQAKIPPLERTKMDSTATTPRKQRPTLSPELCAVVNLDLLGSAWEQRDDASPPRLPRLSKRPESRPLLESEAA